MKKETNKELDKLLATLKKILTHSKNPKVLNLVAPMGGVEFMTLLQDKTLDVVCVITTEKEEEETE